MPQSSDRVSLDLDSNLLETMTIDSTSIAVMTE